MNRRKFLTWVAASTAAFAVPELWTPKRTFFLPPRSGWQYRADGWWEHNFIIPITGSFLYSSDRGVVVFNGVAWVPFNLSRVQDKKEWTPPESRRFVNYMNDFNDAYPPLS